MSESGNSEANSCQFPSPSKKLKPSFKPIKFSSTSGKWEGLVTQETTYLPDQLEIRSLPHKLVVSQEIRVLQDELGVSGEIRVLPDDLVTEILEWLPIKYIVRFRCVSKLWSALFRNPVFIRNHRLKAKCDTMLLLRRRLPRRPLSTHDTLSSKDLDEVLSFHELDSPERNVRPSQHISDYLKDLVGGGDDSCVSPCKNCVLRLLGPINGIICIKYGCQHYILCNPALREYKLLPPLFLDSPNEDYYPHIEADGFGVSYSEEEDFKIVVMHSFLHRGKGIQRPLSCVPAHLYIRKTNSWRQLDDAPLVPVMRYDGVSIFFNGACHWCGFNYARDHKTILSFNMTSEVFLLLELPNCLQVVNDLDPQPVVLNNCFGVAQHKIRASLEIWVMREYGVNDSWTKQFVISPQPLLTFFLPWKNDTLLLIKRIRYQRRTGSTDKGFDSKDQLASIDLRTSEMRKFQVFGALGTLCSLIYEESLVSLN